MSMREIKATEPIHSDDMPENMARRSPLLSGRLPQNCMLIDLQNDGFWLTNAHLKGRHVQSSLTCQVLTLSFRVE